MNGQTLYDKNGVPIEEGDLLRTEHFRGPRRKMYYLYHGVVRNEKHGVLEMVPIQELCGLKPQGGRCWVKATREADDSDVMNVEVMTTCISDDRKRKMVTR